VAERTPLEKTILVVVLPAVAGAVNGSGVFVVGAYTSHATGTLARLGDELAQGNWGPVKLCFWTLMFFLAGTMLATALVDLSVRLGRAKYAMALCAEAGLLGLVAFGAALFPLGKEPYQTLLLLFLGLSMGLQNALVTRISGAVVRTTHMTGVLTDFGMELTHLALFLRDRVLGVVGRTHEQHKKHDLQRLAFHATILMSFFTGAVLGPLAYLTMGPLALMAPALVLLGLAYVDARIGIKVTAGDARRWRDETEDSVPPTPLHH